MPTKRYPLEKGGPKRLEVSWGFGRLFNNTTIRVDGNAIGSIPNAKELIEGKEFVLPDGSKLAITLKGGMLEILRNGYPIPNSEADANVILNGIFALTIILAAINILYGIYLLTQKPIINVKEFGLIPIIGGLIFLILGLFVKMKSSKALGGVIGLFAILIITNIIGLIMNIKRDPALLIIIIGNIIIFIFFIRRMIGGFDAISKLRNSRKI